MKRLIKASYNPSIADLFNEAKQAISKKCSQRNKGEYVDEAHQYSKDGFEIPVYVNTSDHSYPSATFYFKYDPYDELGMDAEEQMHLQLNEFFEEWESKSFEEDDYSGNDFVHDAIVDVVYNCYKENKGKMSEEDAADYIVTKLQGRRYNLVEDEDFTIDDVFEEMDNYSWNLV